MNDPKSLGARPFVFFLFLFLAAVFLAVFVLDLDLVSETGPKKEGLIDAYILLPGQVVDLEKDWQPMAYADLLALMVHLAEGWEEEAKADEAWQIPYLERALALGWVEEVPRDLEEGVSQKQALLLANRLLVKRGKYGPLNQPLYYEKDLLAAYPDLREDPQLGELVLAYGQGLWAEGEDWYKEEPLSKKKARLLLGRFLDPSILRPRFLLLFSEDQAKLSFTAYDFPQGLFYPGDNLTSQLTLENKGSEDKRVWLGLSYKDPLGDYIDVPALELFLEKGKSQTFVLSHILEEGRVSGPYQAIMSLWTDKPGQNPQARRMAYVEKTGGMRIYRQMDDFTDFNQSLWRTSSSSLGRGTFSPKYVYSQGGLLFLGMKADSYDSGELRSRELLSYGSYEVSMQLAHRPGSLTGFFMYKAPDYDQEIDIELYNENKGQIFFTTYAEGKRQKAHEGLLAFDPTADFHRYRFDYYPDRLTFFVDGEARMTYEAGYPKADMYLMLNTWYPLWLEGERPQEDAQVKVDWIRY